MGAGIAVLHGWSFRPDRLTSAVAHTGLDDFRRLSRDLCVPPGSTGFWQGALRDGSDPLFQAAVGAIGARRPVTVELLYGDHESGQRTVSRFALSPVEDGRWVALVSRHWNIDRPDPR
ncbi:MAG TPA: hypothetical protein VFW71_04060 [Actinomycetota bacterium]|nr:hypothetical protein [Actinomycetota bacterium]